MGAHVQLLGKDQWTAVASPGATALQNAERYPIGVLLEFVRLSECVDILRDVRRVERCWLVCTAGFVGVRVRWARLFSSEESSTVPRNLEQPNGECAYETCGGEEGLSKPS